MIAGEVPEKQTVAVINFAPVTLSTYFDNHANLHYISLEK